MLSDNCLLKKELEKYLTKNKLKEFFKYLGGLNNNEKEYILISKVADVLDTTSFIATRILDICVLNEILNVYFLIKCPEDECNNIIQKDIVDPVEILGKNIECDFCGKDFIVNKSDIYVYYSLKEDNHESCNE